MRRKISLKPITLLLLLTTFVSFGKEQEGHGEQKTGKATESEVKAYIQHHLKDSYDFNLFSYTTDAGEEKHVGFPLPVILWDNGLKVFSSSKFHHGKTIAEVGGDYYKLHHSKIYKVDGPNGEIIEDENHHAINDKPLDFSITKNVTMIFMVFAIMFFMFSRMAKSYKKNNGMPKGMGRFLEPIVLYVRDEIAIPNIGEKHYKRYMSYLLTVFFFVWIVNLFGLTPIGMNVTNNIAVTLCLALITYFITTFSGNKNYWKHIFWMPGVPVPMKIILAPIELLGTIIKPFALMIRLYANITAGHVVLMSIIGMIFLFQNWIGSSLSFLLAFVLAILELLVAALQAYIFTVLSALYFGMAVEEHHDEAH
ncbi:F0F1 ATP synthase subunit A [Sabulilitoribacter multivorans]|uniref:ATP synthase subunit a n=1 Tax=Flaviramulus multivorans TaxID=1304750 RepID=A0ABS9IFT9_9FLAO|nr:F0F1 ATP synthase subunit A [Flaviramulus multivorans]MCF7559629.1 F0F1 ATP synthase subunit A [Flaviramulus multivorans]